MSDSVLTFKTGTRDSPLAVTQAEAALVEMHSAIPFVRFELVELSSPGDRDQAADLNDAAADFFTRDLDDGVLSGELDCAIHSAKDMVYPAREGVDWFWLPWSADRRDALVFRKGEGRSEFPDGGVLGVSSERREAYGREYMGGFEQRPVRGAIGVRLEQLDRGDFDALIIAGAALIRLGLEDRVSEWIPFDELDPPDAQGILGVSFRAGDERLIRIRNALFPCMTIAGAGPGEPDLATRATHRALQQCDVCLHDALVSGDLLSELPAYVERVDVGKRSGAHYMSQQEICAVLLDKLREGKRVVRLKGGDPGMFGRLSEEVEALENGGFPYHVIPGVSSFHACTTGTGMLMTRRGLSRGVSLMTPRVAGGQSRSVSRDVRADLPLAFFMAVSRAGAIAQELQADGRPGDEACAVVFSAGSVDEHSVHGTLSTIAERLEAGKQDGPGLLLVGDTFSEEFLYDRSTALLQGKRIVLACSEALQDKAATIVRAMGGVPVRAPMIRVVPAENAIEVLGSMDGIDWVVVTSPSAVHVFMDVFMRGGLDVRRLPRLMVCGTGTADALRGYGVVADHVPATDFGRAGLVASAGEVIRSEERVLRIRSDLAGKQLGDELRVHTGAEVRDCVLYRTCDVVPEKRPEGDAFFFGSSSAARSYISQFGVGPLLESAVVAIGPPTHKTLTDAGVVGCIVPEVATVEDAVRALGLSWLRRSLQSLNA